jgi:lipoate-protein ligase A
LFENYSALAGAFSRAFLSLGLQSETKTQRKSGHRRSALCFQSVSYGEITVGGRKAIGSAQKRWPDGLLQQGSIPLTIDLSVMERVFGTDGLPAAMVGLREAVPDLSEEDLKGALEGAFREAFGIGLVRSAPSPEEEARAGELLRRKYLRSEWNLRR